jgi:predicted phosphoribosyltransferase
VQLVVGLARGGVAVAAPIARALGVPLDVLIIKKISSPHNSELAVGALAPDGVAVVHWRMAHRVGADEAYIKTQKEALAGEIKQKSLLYRKGKGPLNVTGREVVVVDDGAATGATLEAAVLWLRAKKAKRVIVALPVCAPEVISRIAPEVSSVVVLHTAEDMGSVGEYYDEFAQITDEEVVALLRSEDKTDIKKEKQ